MHDGAADERTARRLRAGQPVFAAMQYMEGRDEIARHRGGQRQGPRGLDGGQASGGGVSSRLSETGEELMRPYDDLSEAAKELDRASVKAVYAAIWAVGEAPPDDG
jgi:hypothetical protein